MRRWKGTPCHRQLSTSALRATKVSVCGVGGDALLVAVALVLAAYHVVEVDGPACESKTLLFSSRSALAVSEAGGSMATKPRTWKRWVTTMSRKAPVAS